MLGLAYLRGDSSLESNLTLAAHWIEPAALQGNGYAERLGDFYAAGLGVTKNSRLAADWREKTAKRGIVSAQVKLRKMYLNGGGIKKDPGRAHYWIERAAFEGNAEAQFLLGRI